MDPWGIRRFPFLTRRSFHYEFQHILFWSVLAGMVEGQFASVVVAKTFQGGPLLIAIATASPFAAYVFSLLWGMLCVGRRKIRLLMFFGTGTVLCTAGVAAVPVSRFGAVWFIVQIAAAQALLAGVVTVRSAIWRSNYPREVRGQITSRIQGMRSVISVFAVQCAAAIGDADPASYRYVFPAAAVFGAIGVVLLPRVRVRGERSELRRNRQVPPDDDLHVGMIEPYNLTALLSPGHVFGQAYRILRNDRRFSEYCVAQFLQGLANLMTIPIVVTVITRDLQAGAFGFWISTALIVAIPTLSLLASVGRWGRLFDGLGVVRFRVINVVCWTAAILMGMVATIVVVRAEQWGSAYFPLAVLLFALRGILHGVGQGGGTLAWNLGHLHFTEASQAELYMGIHVFLAGVRGLIGPLAGMWLWIRIGWPVWLIALACCLSGLMVYAHLARFERRMEMKKGE